MMGHMGVPRTVPSVPCGTMGVPRTVPPIPYGTKGVLGGTWDYDGRLGHPSLVESGGSGEGTGTVAIGDGVAHYRATEDTEYGYSIMAACN